MNEWGTGHPTDAPPVLPAWLREETQAGPDAVKERFLANISHEMRTPLNGILGSVRLLEMMPHDPGQTELFESIHDSARRLIHLVENVLLHTEIEAGRHEAVSELFSPALFLRDLLDAYRGRVNDGERVTLRLEGEEQLPAQVLGDRRNLALLLQQLIDNAIRHTPRGEIVLKASLVAQGGRCRDEEAASGCSGRAAAGTTAVDARGQAPAPLSDPGERRPSGKPALQVQVRDTGTGIDPEVVPDLFNAFRLVDDSFTRRYQGAGLGLLICRKLARLMGGQVDVCSTKGEGSCFSVQVPVETDTAPKQAPASREVLVVEDDLTSRTLMGMFCALFGLHASLAASAPEALNLHGSQSFRLILTDIQMPGMSGVELLGQIREHERGTGRHTVVIAVTAYAMDGDRERMLQAGFDDYLEKPVDLNMFERIIRRWMASQEDI